MIICIKYKIPSAVWVSYLLSCNLNEWSKNAVSSRFDMVSDAHLTFDGEGDHCVITCGDNQWIEQNQKQVLM